MRTTLAHICCVSSLLALLIGSNYPANCSADNLPIGDFTGTNYGDWKMTGTAFKSGPASGELLTRLQIENAGGTGVASSEIEGDAPTGTLTSPLFDITRKYIAFRISGGDYERHACLNLLVNGQIVRSATGRNNDWLRPASWDVSEFAGQTARLEIVDEASGDWGHVNVGQIVQTDAPDCLPAAVWPVYQEPWRPQFHFTGRQWTINRLSPGMRQEGWVNDLNGLIFYEGEYHLFAQRWNKCWVHAVSRDLVHWTELKPAFWEEHLDSGVQSGTCVIDYENTSGLSLKRTNPPMVAFYSRNDNRSQCIAYSLDHGRSWKHYEKNPVLSFPERDPKVFWHQPGGHWVMFLYGSGQYHIFTSANLLDWRDEKNPIPNSFECPDFFEMPVDGNINRMKWVLIQGNGQYSIGSFNGTKFTEETPRYPSDINHPNFYATQSWHNNETGDGRRIQCAWIRHSNFPDMPFNQQISFPCELTLRSTSQGLRIFREPVREIQLLHRDALSWTNRMLKTGEVLPLATSGDLFRIRAEFSVPEGARLTFHLRGVPLVLTPRTIQSGDVWGAALDMVQTVEILLDRASVEAFVNRGEVSCTRFILPNENNLSVQAEGGTVTLHSLTVNPLRSAWTAEH